MATTAIESEVNAAEIARDAARANVDKRGNKQANLLGSIETVADEGLEGNNGRIVGMANSVEEKKQDQQRIRRYCFTTRGIRAIENDNPNPGISGEQRKVWCRDHARTLQKITN